MRTVRHHTFLSGAWHRFVARRLVLVGLVLVIILVLIGLFGRFMAPYRPIAQDLTSVLAAPTASHWLGTDELGRDVLSRLLYGATISLQVGIAAVLIASVPGVILGTYVGYRRGLVDNVVMRVLDG
ncbi:MAG: ABC transporter permease, partial [Chloroflexi bacterium]|nr:ABC transporter permease [Chloroflexota bacterium]